MSKARTIWNPNTKTFCFWHPLKSKRSDFGALLYLKQFITSYDLEIDPNTLTLKTREQVPLESLVRVVPLSLRLWISKFVIFKVFFGVLAAFFGCVLFSSDILLCVLCMVVLALRQFIVWHFNLHLVKMFVQAWTVLVLFIRRGCC